jgi:hypothetical protein
MFDSYEMTRALVNERQGTLRHEARQHRLVRGVRQIRRAASGARVTRLTAPADPAPPVGRSLEDRAAA